MVQVRGALSPAVARSTLAAALKCALGRGDWAGALFNGFSHAPGKTGTLSSANAGAILVEGTGQAINITALSDHEC
jgi:hypothetical protein